MNKMNELIKCACGCGEFRNKFDKKGRERSYIKGHMCKQIGFQKNNEPWNKGLAGNYPQEMRENMRKAHLGIPLSEQHKQNLRKALKGHSTSLKGKTFEDIHGIEKARIRKEKMSKLWKGRTYEDIYGEERAKIIKENHRKSALGDKYIFRKSMPIIKNSTQSNVISDGILNKCFSFLFPKICNCGCNTIIPWKSYSTYHKIKFIKHHHFKNRTFEERYGKKKAMEMRKKASMRLKGKTYEERFGIFRTQQIKQNMSNALKGRSYEELYGKEVAEVRKSEKREWRANLIFPKKDTKIEVKIQDYLKILGVSFFTHQYVSQIKHSYQCDIWIPIMNLIIECDGDYWHANPDRFKDEDLDEKQRLQKERDTIRTKELIEQGFKILRLWEDEIKVMDLSEFKKKLEC